MLPPDSYLRHTLPYRTKIEEDRKWPIDCSLVSVDGSAFGVCSDVLKTGSALLREICISHLSSQVDIAPNNGAAGGMAPGNPMGLPQVDIRQDSETTLALLHAIYPQPFIPINDLDLAEKSVAAAEYYGIELSKLEFDHSLFDPAKISQHPLRYCVFAWRMELEDGLKLSSRYALGSLLPLEDPAQYRIALGTVGGVDVLTALLGTKMVRNKALDYVLDILPQDLVCLTCRAQGRTGLAEAKDVIEGIFDQPYPDLHRITDNTMWAQSEFADICVTKTCEPWLREYHFSEHQQSELASSVLRVPYLIDMEYYKEYQEHRRRHARRD